MEPPRGSKPPGYLISAELITVTAPALVFAFLIAYDWERPAWPAVIAIGGVGLSILDILCLTVAGFALARVCSNLANVRPGAGIAWITALVAAFGVSIIVGIGVNGKADVAAETRQWFQLLAIFCWVVVVLPTSETYIVRNLMLIIGWALGVFAVYHMVTRGLGRPDEILVGADGIDRSTRILRSAQALMITCCGMAAIDYGVRFRQTLWTLTGVGFIILSLLSQNRSVWIATVVALAAYLLLTRNVDWGRVVPTVAFVSVVLFAAAITDTGKSVIEQVRGELSNRNTYNDRQAGWSYLIDKSVGEGWTRIVFGQSAGSGWDRPGGAGGIVGYQPHNWYLTVYLRTGLVGLALLAVVITIILVVLIRRRDALGLAWTAAVLVYGWAYGFSWYLGILLGLIVIRVVPGILTTEPEMTRIRGPEERQRGEYLTHRVER